MRGERYQNRMAIFLIVLLIFVAVPLTVNLPSLWFLWVPVMAAFAILPAIFLWEADLVTGLLAPSQACDALAAHLRAAGVSVTAERDTVRARTGALSSVEFRARTTDRGTALSYQTRATPAGWALLIALVVSVVGSVPAAVLALVLFLRSRRFARAHAPSAVQGAESPSAVGRDEVHTMLVGGLSTALRTVRDALESQKKAYTDAQALAGIAAATVFMGVLVGLFVALNGLNLETGQWDVPFIGAGGATVAVVTAVAIALRRRFSSRIARYRTWLDRLTDAFDTELSRRPVEPAATSTFELLAEASTQVPDWLEAQRRAGLSGDPRTSYGILLTTLVSASSFMSVVIDVLRGRLVSAGLEAVLGAGAAAIAAWIYRGWRSGEDGRLAESKVAWDAHVAALKSRMDRFLEEM